MSLGRLARRILYRLLPFETYLYLLSKGFFWAYRTGRLRGQTNYKYPYFLADFIQPGWTVIDIGANLGYYSRLFAEWVGTQGQVFSVEPVAPVRRVLKRNTQSFPQVTILPYALGTEDKPIRLGNDSLRKFGYVASGSHFILDADADTDVEFAAQMKRGSLLFADLERIDFIKCDIEGYETVVLPELRELLARHRPAVLVETAGEKREQILALFAELGYRAYQLDEELRLVPMWNGEEDLLFLPV
jgi:FkbM family methyltransferase